MDKPATQQAQTTTVTPQPTPITSPVVQAPLTSPALPVLSPIDWLLRPKPAAMLLAMKIGGEQNVSVLAKKSSMSYVHALEMLKRLEEGGVVTTESRGNRRFVRLTETGTAFVSALEELVKKAPAKKV